jgi:hypothetical protein
MGLAYGLQSAGRDIQSLGNATVAYARRQREAEDTVKLETEGQQFLQDLDKTEEEQRKTLPPEQQRQGIIDEGKKLIEGYKLKMEPRLQKRFAASAERFLTGRARGVQDRAFVEFERKGKAALQASVEAHAQRFLESSNPTEQALHLEGLRETLERGELSALITREESVLALQKVERDGREFAGRLALRANPAQAVQQFKTLLDGGTTGVEVYDRVPRNVLPKLHDEAKEQLRAQVAERAQGDAQAQRTLTDRQGRTASAYRAIVLNPATSTQDLLALVPTINSDRRTQELGEEDHASLLRDVQTILSKRQSDAAQDRDVPLVARTAVILIELAKTPDDLIKAKNYVSANASQLSEGSLSKFYGRIENRQTQGAYTNRDAYKEGRQTILGAAFPGGIVPAALDQIDAATKTKLSLALDIYGEQMQTIYGQRGPEAGDAAAREEARRLRDLYFDKETTPSHLPGLPPEIGAAQTFDDAVRLIQRLKTSTGDPVPRAFQRQLFQKAEEVFRQGPPPPPAKEKR